MLGDIDYRNYLSIDNGKGLLLGKDVIEVLERYGFDYRNYSSLNNLIFDIDSYLGQSYDDLEDLEEVLIGLSESYYYNEIKK